MEVGAEADGWIRRTHPWDRTVRLSGYIDRAIDDVIREFSTADIDEGLTIALDAALVDEAWRVHVHASAPTRLTPGNARLVVTWEASHPDGRTASGSATLSLLMVRSGHQPMTELLLSVPVSDDTAADTATVGGRALDRLGHWISPAA